MEVYKDQCRGMYQQDNTPNKSYQKTRTIPKNHTGQNNQYYACNQQRPYSQISDEHFHE
jgi:hypothetical protein